jgi:YaiO family outer membrane protein
VQTETSALEELAYKRPSVFDSTPYIEAGYTTDHLTNNYLTWDSQYVNVFVPLQHRGMFNIQVDNVKRYGMQDQAISGVYAYPLTGGVLNLELSYAANAVYLAKSSAGLVWNGRLPNGFGYTIGTSQRQYLESQTAIYRLGLEKYLGNFRFAYTGLLSTINGVQPAYGQFVQAQWVGENLNKFGLSYAQGMEPMVVSAGTLASIKTKYMQADGLYWINKQIGITAALWHGLQGDFYQRNGGQIGVRVTFN